MGCRKSVTTSGHSSEVSPLYLFIEEDIRVLAQSVKDENEKDFEVLAKLFTPWIKKTASRLNGKFLNLQWDEVLNEAKTQLYLGIFRFDEKRHKSIKKFLGNFMRDQLRTEARKEKDEGFPGFELIYPPNDQEDLSNPVEETDTSIYGNNGSNPEQSAIQRQILDRIVDYRNALQQRDNNGRGVINQLKVLDDILENPHDITIRSISKRTGLPKSTVGDCLKKIRTDLSQLRRTDCARMTPELAGVEETSMRQGANRAGSAKY